MTATGGWGDFSVAGGVNAPSAEAVEAALAPVLRKRFPGDPRLEFRYLSHLDDLRIQATGFDMVLQGTAHGYTFGSSFVGPRDALIELYRDISAALTRHGLLHEIEIMWKEPDGSWSEVVALP